MLQLSIITYWLTIYWIHSMFDFNNIYSHGLDCTGSLGIFMKTLVSHPWTKLRKIMLWLLTQILDLWRFIIIVYCGFNPFFLIYVVLYPYYMMYSNFVKDLVFQYIEHSILIYDFVYDIIMYLFQALPVIHWTSEFSCNAPY